MQGVKYRVTRRVWKQGAPPGSLVLTIPKIVAEAHKIKNGDQVEIVFDDFSGFLVLKKEAVECDKSKEERDCAEGPAQLS